MSDQSSQAKQAFGAAHRLDLALVGAGALALLGSLLPFYTVSVDMMGMSASESATAWHGFFGWFGVVAAVVGSALLAAHVLGVAVRVPVRIAVLAAYAVAVLCLVVALFVFPGGGCDDLALLGADLCDGFDFGRGLGYWISLLAALAGLALAVVRRGAGDASPPASPSTPSTPADPASPAT